jgi:hypothetical protein
MKKSYTQGSYLFHVKINFINFQIRYMLTKRSNVETALLSARGESLFASLCLPIWFFDCTWHTKEMESCKPLDPAFDYYYFPFFFMFSFFFPWCPKKRKELYNHVHRSMHVIFFQSNSCFIECSSSFLRNNILNCLFCKIKKHIMELCKPIYSM